MHPIFPTIWDVFHDGSVDRVEGSVPGTVTVYVGIQYLREMFPEPGEHFIVTLRDCTMFSYKAYDSDEVITDFAGIADAWPGILSAEMDGVVCKVFGENGLMQVSSSDGSIRLDSGREISLEELLQAATKYWDDWEAKSRDKS